MIGTTTIQVGQTFERPSKFATDWNTIKNNRELAEVAAYRNAHPDCDNIEEVEALYQKLRDEELKAMVFNPSRCKRQDVETYMALGVFSPDDLIDAGVATPESLKKMQIRRDYLPEMSDFQKIASDSQTAPRGTDIYFFGMPTAGKTALLMGIAAANGQGYTVDMRSNGGPYAAALRQYAQAGISPGRTYGKFVTTIGGIINDVTPRGKVRNYPVNLIEMSGEEFALRISETTEPSIANMGTGVTNLLRNDNRKIFFIIIDASKQMVKVNYLDHEIDEEGEISNHVRCRYISQLDILDKFAVLIGLPENQEIMNKVDAIHFIVTKSDAMGQGNEREEKADELISTQYLSVVEQLKNVCRASRRIDRDRGYEPSILTFSLGKFYVGDVFEYDPKDTLKIIDAIRNAANSGRRSFWQRLLYFFRP